MHKKSSVIYRINSQDQIVFVNDRWNQFASANDSVHLMKHGVLGKSLWDFITDYSTRDLYQQMVNSVRKGKTVEFKFRCDSPNWRRFLEMHITTHKDHTVQFECKTIFTEDRPLQKLLDKETLRSEKVVVICSFCKKVNTREDYWHDVEDAVSMIGAFDSEHFPILSHGICIECYPTLLNQLNRKQY